MDINSYLKEIIDRFKKTGTAQVPSDAEIDAEERLSLADRQEVKRIFNFLRNFIEAHRGELESLATSALTDARKP